MGKERGAEGEGNVRKLNPSALCRGDQQARCEGRTHWRRIRRRGLSLDERYPRRCPAALTRGGVRLGRYRPEFDPEQDQVPVRGRNAGRRGGRTQGRPPEPVRVPQGRDVPVVHDGPGEDDREPAGEQGSAQATHELAVTNRKDLGCYIKLWVTPAATPVRSRSDEVGRFRHNVPRIALLRVGLRLERLQ